MKYFITAPNRTDLYWRPNSQGYTTNLAQAGLYDEKTAQGILRNQRGDMLIPFDNRKEELIELREERQQDVYKLDEMLKDN